MYELFIAILLLSLAPSARGQTSARLDTDNMGSAAGVGEASDCIVAGTAIVKRQGSGGCSDAAGGADYAIATTRSGILFGSGAYLEIRDTNASFRGGPDNCANKWHLYNVLADSIVTLNCPANAASSNQPLEYLSFQPSAGSTYHYAFVPADGAQLFGNIPSPCDVNGCMDQAEVTWVASNQYIVNLTKSTMSGASTCPPGYTCYYFAASGNDFTGAGTLASPWKTVSKAMTKVNLTVSTPTAVLFNQGDTWTAQEFDLSGAVGTAANPIIIGTYGTGAQPIFDENNINNYCFSVDNAVAKYITLGFGAGFECEHAKLSGINFFSNGSETATVPAMPGITIENNYVHNTGPGCATGIGPCTGTDPGDYEHDNQISFIIEATCQNTTGGCAGDSVKILGNTVRYVGGHNCMEVHGDHGQAEVAFNKVGPGCTHEVIDTKQSGFSNATTPGARTELVHDNIVDVGNAQGQAAFILLASYDAQTSVKYYNNIAYDTAIGFEVCTENQLASNGAAGVACAAGPNCNMHAFLYNNTVYSRGTSAAGLLGPWCNVGSTTLNGAISSAQTTLTATSGTNFVPSVGFGAPFIISIDNEQILVGGASSATAWNTLTRGYNGTTAASHSNGATIKGGAYGTGYIDARNNIWDGSNFNEVDDKQPFSIIAENFNDCGGVQGRPTGTAPNSGTWTCNGVNDLINIDPNYTSANYNTLDSSNPPAFKIQNPTLTGPIVCGHRTGVAIGAYQ